MKNTVKRSISLLLAILMLISLLPMSALALGAESFELTGTVVEMDGTSDATAKVSFKAKSDMTILAIEAQFVENSDKITMTDFEFPVALTGQNGMDLDTGLLKYADDSWAGFTVAEGDSIYTAVYTLDSDIPADRYEVEFSIVYLMDGEYEELYEGSYTATIEVKKPEAAKTGFEIYYELNGKTSADDEDADKFVEYGVGDTVTADVYLVNYDKADVLLQAYDIYLTYDSNLSYVSEDLDGTAYKADGTEAAAADVVSHIQLVAEENVEIDFPKGEPVKLGSIKFTVANTAVFDVQMPINLVPESENPEEITNIAVGKADKVEGGDKESYYPVDVSEFEGVEVDTEHTVTFDTDGGSEVEEQTVGHNLTATEPEDPTKANHTFVGWYADEELTTEFVFDTAKITEDTTVYAKWEQDTVTVTWYDANGDELTTTTVNKGEEAEYTGEEPTKTKDGYTYTFLGWNTDLDADTALDDLTVTENTEFYPIFSESINKYTVTWKNGETVLESDKDDTAVEYNGHPTYNANEPTMTGDAQYSYEFKGWTTVENPAFGAETIENIGEYKVTGNTVFYAVFDQITNQYEVTYSDEGTTSTSGKVDYNNTTTLPEAKGKTGYTFAGWYSGETRVGGAGDTYTVIGDIALTAKYTANEYTVKFDANGGSGTSMDDMPFTYDEAQNLTKNAFTKENANFAGWNTKADGTGDNYSDGASVKNLTTEANGTVTLYAQWTNLYTVTLDGYTADEGEVTATPAIGAQGTEITLNAVAKEGYEFVGYTAMDASGNPVTVTDGKFNMPASNVTVTATFEKSDLTVKVDSVENGDVTIENGETDVTEKNDAHVGEDVILNVVPNPGYKVESVTYVKSDDDTAAAQEATPGENNTYTFPMPGYGVTVEVKFAAISYTIVFDGNGATTGSMTSITDVKFDADQKLPKNAFTIDGYTFAGWSYNGATYADEATVKNLTTEDGATVTLVAQWTEATYTITLNTNEGVYAEGYTAPATYVFGTGATLPTAANITKTGHDFGGWFDNAECTGTAVETISATTYGNKEYWAKWTPSTYTITYDSNGGSAIENGTYTYGVGLDELPVPTNPGYEFAGWYIGSDKVESIAETETGDKALKAEWNAKEYEITFNGNGGLFAGDVTRAYDIETVIELPTVSRNNYTFDGWKVTKVDENEGNWGINSTLNVDATTTPTGKYGNVTLTAQWTRAAVVEVEDYKYAASGYYMIRVAAGTLDEGKEYQFNSKPMYFIDNEYYAVGDDTKVFYTLVEAKYVDTTDMTLTDEGYALLTTADCAERTEIDYNGDINEDNVLNVADANIIYQMVINGGGYYGDTLDVEARLKADMAKSTDDTVNEHRGSIADVNEVVNDINGTN